MSAFGRAGLTKQPGGVYKVDLSGFATYDKSVSGLVPAGHAFGYQQGDIAAEWPSTVLMSITVTETGDQCQHVRLDLHYEGKDMDFGTPETALDLSVDFTTSQEPIESHKDFTKDIGGSPGKAKHGAFFDATTGEFLGFPVVDPDEPEASPSRFAGLRSYLMPQQTYTASTVEFSYPDSKEIESIGRVFTPTVPLPALPGDRNWLNTGIRVQNIANAYFRTQKTGMLSGPRKWVKEIYGEG